MSAKIRRLRFFWVPLVFGLLFLDPLEAVARARGALFLSARSAAILDANTGEILFAKNPHLRLAPASTTKVMTAMIALERLPADARILIGPDAVRAAPSKAGLTAGARYAAKDLVTAALVASSNDAAVTLAEAVSGSESAFAVLMNQKAARLGLKNTRFVNATGLPSAGRSPDRGQYSTAYDLSRLMWYASRDPRIDGIMAIRDVCIRGSDGRAILLKSHNKMLWKTPCFVKGKTGWTCASRHTFMGTNYSRPKRFTFAMLCSNKPWIDIKRLATFGTAVAAKNRF